MPAGCRTARRRRWVESLFAARNVPCVTLQGDARRARRPSIGCSKWSSSDRSCERALAVRPRNPARANVGAAGLGLAMISAHEAYQVPSRPRGPAGAGCRGGPGLLRRRRWRRSAAAGRLPQPHGAAHLGLLASASAACTTAAAASRRAINLRLQPGRGRGRRPPRRHAVAALRPDGRGPGNGQTVQSDYSERRHDPHADRR